MNTFWDSWMFKLNCQQKRTISWGYRFGIDPNATFIKSACKVCLRNIQNVGSHFVILLDKLRSLRQFRSCIFLIVLPYFPKELQNQRKIGMNHAPEANSNQMINKSLLGPQPCTAIDPGEMCLLECNTI